MENIVCTYLCPFRSNTVDMDSIREFYRYWDMLCSLDCEVLVVDGSPAENFEVHAREWTNCRHVKVDPQFTYLNGKVNGILTGVPLAAHEKIILADDDIRYTEANILRMVHDLDIFEVVRPQNYFFPNPLWTQIDSARILLNRAYFPEGDFPGTLGFRKNVFTAAGAFDGNVLFDNEELVKHFQNNGANISFATDFFIQRKPPNPEKWMEQRPRQAYEDFVMEERTAFFLALLPVHLLLLFSGKRKTAGLLALLISGIAIAKAIKGRKNGAGKYIPLQTVVFAPLWILERGINVYLALYWKLTKGGYPFGDRLIAKGTGDAWKKT